MVGRRAGESRSGTARAVAVLGALLSACGADRVPGKPAMSAHEATQHDRCIALLRPMLHGQPVRSTSIERGPNSKVEEGLQ